MDFAFIRKSVPILETASRLGLAVTRNRSRCLFPERHSHGDRTPSLTFNPATNSFKCWVCDDVKGSVLDLVMQVKGVGIREAVSYLQEEGLLQAGDDGRQTRLPVQGPRTAAAPVPSCASPETPALAPETRSEIYTFLMRLCQGLTPECQRYLRSRRIFAKTAQRMRLCSIADYSETAAALEGRYPRDLLRKAGLFNEKGNLRFYKHSLLVPYFLEGRVVFFQARAIDKTVVPKELNPTGPIPAPYNIDTALRAPILYICEGAIDTLTLIEQGFPAVGIPGAGNFKPAWVEYFKGKRVFSVLDADNAGRAGTERLKTLFLEQGIRFESIAMPDNTDINDLFTGKRSKTKA